MTSTLGAPTGATTVDAPAGARPAPRTPSAPARPRWERPAFVGLLVATAVLYLWDLGASGWANTFYSAAVQAGTQSWKAFFFGSFDAANAITVDKPPASLWVMELFARIFGVNAWSILVPQALEGVAAVALLYATVRRRFEAPAALLAGAVMASTPVAVLMFRFNNPDALLVLLLVAAAYALTRALETASTRWLMLCGALVGFAFLSKMLQAFVVVPGFAVVYLLAAPTPLRRRILQVLGAGAAMLVAGGWWVAIVELWPASARPYIGGSQTNSELELIFGYNGLGRLTGNETGSVVAGGNQGQAGMWGPTGLLRLFTAEMGGQVAWLLPAALILLGYLLWMARRAPLADGRRAQVLLWGTWLVVTGLVFSLAQGIIHPYYTVALAPAIGGLVGIGAWMAWRYRARPESRVVLAAVVLVTALWSCALLDRSPDWLPWLKALVLVAGLAAAVGLLLPLAGRTLGRQASAGVVGLALVAGLAGPAAYSVDTATTPHAGAIPSAGPAVASGFGPGGGGFRGRFGRGFGQGQQGFAGPGFTPGTGQGGGTGGFAGRQGGLGGLLEAGTPDAELVALLTQDTTSTWVAAAVGSNSAAGVQLATGRPVMAIGGFNGSDPSPTLEQFQALVAAGKIHYFLAGGAGGPGFGGFGPGGGSGTSGQIASWVESTFPSTTVGGVTVYDLTQSGSGATTADGAGATT
ncbi:MAG TPA: glycosyltransferase family 39 protein [Kineosporiaceae bacterium]|nr:glycosyltransferase family 39 protein [Kineosporiaceae bacterium]